MSSRHLTLCLLIVHGLSAACNQRVEWPDTPDALHGKLAAAPWDRHLLRDRQIVSTPEAAYRLERQIAERQAELAEEASWETLNDLAVLELESSRILESGEDLVASLEHAAHAVELSERPEALFNLGLLLSILELEHTAGETWERFTQLAERHSLPGALRRLGPRILAQQRRTAEPSSASQDVSQAIWTDDALMTEGEEPAAEIVDRIRLQAERGLLEKWAMAVLADDRAVAEESLQSGLRAGYLVARVTGDWLVYDLYTALEEVTDRTTAAAHLELVEGLRTHHEGDYSAAAVVLEDAAASLAELGSPGALLAKSFLARSVYYADVAASEVIASRALETVDAERYPLLAGHLHWRLGVALGTGGRNTEAIRHFLRSRDLVNQGQTGTEASFVDALLANEYRELGDFRSAWSHRIRAVRVSPAESTHTRRHSLLNQMVEALTEEGYRHAARIVAREMVLHAEATGMPKLRMFAHWMRASSRLMIGDDGVMEDVKAARRFARAVSEEGLTRIELSLDALAAQASLASNPATAETSFTPAVETFRREENIYELELTLLARAEARASLSDLDGARSDLEEVLEITEKRREPVTGTARATSLRRAQAAFDGLVRIALAEADPLVGLEIAEQSRARYLLETAAAHADLAVADGPSLLQAVPAGTVILFYAVLEDGTTICWQVADGRVRQHVLSKDRELTAEAGRYRRLMEARIEGPAESRLATRLYDRLIAPAGLDFERFDRLIVVPDRELFRLPFAALKDPRSGRRLIETVPIVTVPSLSLLFTPSATELPHRSGALILVEPGSVHNAELGWFPALPGTRREAEALAAFYSEAWRVEGSELTDADLIRALGKAEVFHFAGHSIERGGQLGGSGLLLSRTDGESSLFSLEQLPRDQVPPDLVYLSSCRSMGGYRVDREGVLGLASFFFARGSNAVVGTLWEADDETSVELATSFHRDHRRGTRASQALRQAVLDAGLDRVPAHTWANYVVMEKVPPGKETGGHGDDA